MLKNNKHKYLALSILLIFIFFQFSYGFQSLVPSNISWLMSVYHDWGQHYLGWAYFRAEPWHFPLGNIENYNYPAGTNIGFTDSIPLVAIFFKLFSFLLSDTFQYFGLWFLSCHLLLGYFTFKVLHLYSKNYILIVILVVLVSFNPLLLYRALHPALCAQWVIVASLYYYLINATKNNVHTINKKQIIVLVLSALINPYLFLMVVGFAFILPFKSYYFDKLISLKQVFLYVFTGLFTVIIGWFLIGMISFGSNKSMEVENSFGLYGLNLNSLYNSSGWSTFFQAFKTYSPRQYEGFSYLGLGFFILLILGCLYLLYISIKKPIKIQKYYKFLPLILLVIITAIFAITNKVTLNDALLFEYYLPEFIIKFGNIFRASGRFIWIFYYVLILFFVIVFLKTKISEKIKILLIILICGLQFYDIKLLLNKKIESGNYKIKPLNEDKWTAITSNFTKIITYPTFTNSLLYNLDYQDWCFIALKNKLPITNGYVARESGTENNTYQQQLKDDIGNAIINKNDLFIIIPQFLADFNSLIFRDQVNIGYLDGYYYLYSKENQKMKNHQFLKSEIYKSDSIFNKVKYSNRITNIDQPLVVENKIQFNLEKFTFKNQIINTQGWAFATNNPSVNDSIFIALSNDKNSYIIKTIVNERLDVADHFKNKNLINAGFQSNTIVDKLQSGTYNLLIGIKSGNEIIYQSANKPAIELINVVKPTIIKKPLRVINSVTYNLEENSVEIDKITMSGWCFINDISSINTKISIILNNNNTIYSFNTTSVQRPDVLAHFGQKLDSENVGFKLIFDKKVIKAGEYTIGFLFENKEAKSELVMMTDKKINLN